MWWPHTLIDSAVKRAARARTRGSRRSAGARTRHHLRDARGTGRTSRRRPGARRTRTGAGRRSGRRPVEDAAPWRSASSSAIATISDREREDTIRQVTSIDHVKTGIRSSVIPGARRRSDGGEAARRPAAMPAAAARIDPADPEVHPAAGARRRRLRVLRRPRRRPAPPRVRKPDHMISAAEDEQPEAEQVSRGHAISAAPTCSGTK